MFTGIITDVGRVAAIERRGDTLITIESRFDIADAPIGASIACNGCCLTVVARSPGHFSVEASSETLSLTTLGTWRPGTAVNLERALRLGDELGGHIVSGHVDGIATVARLIPEGDSHRLTVVAPAALARFIAPKGSVTLDGVSLTVNEVEGSRFGINIIPHTWTHTRFRDLRDGDAVNIEIDMLARYVARLAETR